MDHIIAPLSGEADLTGQIALVTGGAGGIGAKTVELLRNHGAIVYALDLVPEDPANNIIHCDVTDRAMINQIVSDIEAKHNRIDILVTCAGIVSLTKLEDIDDADWDRQFNINTRGTFLIAQAVFAVMKKHNYGKIVTLSSIAGRAAGIQAGPHYAASKGAVLTFSRFLAKIGAPLGIYCNAIAPGPTATSMIKDFDPERVKSDNFPLYRTGMPEDIAHAVLFLASPSSNYITGIYLDVNGGLYMS